MTTTTPRFVRHWKEVFDPTATMIFIKRMKLGIAGAETVAPGDLVTEHIRTTLGAHRLKVWWDARVIGSRDYAIEIGVLKDEPKIREMPIIARGRGWFDVTLRDGTVRKVRSREVAEKLLQQS